jgi:hypothetical protein
VSAAPDMVGPHGQAWKMDLEAIQQKYPNPDNATVCGWIVHAPWAHPFWHSYSIFAVHLRPIPGVKPATIHLEGATHEVLLHALDPEWKKDPKEVPRHLQPANFCGQWIAPTDEAATAKVRECVVDIVHGRLSPDTDYIRFWMARFSDSNIKDKERAGETRIIIEGKGEIVIPPVAVDRPEEGSTPA